jgi:hypothetical protein
MRSYAWRVSQFASRPADRVPEMLRALSPLPSPVDLFIFTVEGLEQARRERTPLVREALASGVDLMS